MLEVGYWMLDAGYWMLLSGWAMYLVGGWGWISDFGCLICGTYMH